MIQIACKSTYFGQDISKLLCSELIQCAVNTVCVETSIESFYNSYKQRSADIVFYESHFFIDPAPLKHINSTCFFVFIASPGEEEKAQKALTCGAGAVLYKPFGIEQVQEVLSFAHI